MLAPPPALAAPPQRFSIDPISLMINECMVISSAMRKMSRWSQSGVAAILGAGDLFGEDDGLAQNLGLSALRGNGAAPQANPLHLSFLQLRAILSETSNVNHVESLTLLQPFLLTIELGATLGHVTTLALTAIAKFLDYGIILTRLKNVQNLLVQLALSLTHCRFEASDQNTDDTVLLKVLRLLESIVVGPLSRFLPNAVISEVIQTCLSLACNKRRSEVLRRAAEMAMVAMTLRIFQRLQELEPESASSEDVPTNFAELPADVIGSALVDTDDEADVLTSPAKKSRSSTLDFTPSRKASTADKLEDQFGIVCINEFFAILISMISPSNQYQHMESTRVFALSLITTAIEVSGEDFPKHPSLMGLVADPVSKDVLQIISSTDSPALLQAALRLFCTMAVVLNGHLKSQIELTFNLLFKSILPPATTTDTIKGNKTAVSTRIASSKELIVESISFLWTRSPQFFSQLFVEFDCDFERTDLATSTIQFLCKLALPESALVATDNVPPICLEGILSFISGISERAKTYSANSEVPQHPLIRDREQKNAFIRCTEIFNESPTKGLAALAEEKFISDLNNEKEVAAFLFQKTTRLNKKKLGEYLSKQSNTALLTEFMRLFDFTGLRVDEGLRLMLKAFRLPGEAQQIDRILDAFAVVYGESQEAEETQEEDPEKESVKPDKDSLLILSFSIILLNTDLHNPQIKRPMTLEAYRKNLRGLYNKKDFPEWYLTKIYNSIRDSEIIMPEEYHGTEKWFDDAWHNLISSQSKYAREHGNSISNFDLSTLRQFDKHLFVSIVDEVIETLLQVFKEASDDTFITKLMSSIDKCANICIIYDLKQPVEHLIESLSELTTLTDLRRLNITIDENIRPEIPITQIKIDKKEEIITVSEMAVHFGRDFKAQLATVVLFRLVKKPNCKVTRSWKNIMAIVLTLFENCLINPNLFAEFQRKLSLHPLNKVKPRFIIQRMKPLKDSGLLSTFSSFLKGYSDDPPEPTDQEVESTLSTIDCVRSVRIPEIFDYVAKAEKEELQIFLEIINERFPEYAEEKRRFFETQVMFLFETSVCLSLILDDAAVYKTLVAKLNDYLKSNHVTKKGYARLSTYLFILVRRCDVSYKEAVLESVNHMLQFDKDILVKHGGSLVLPLLSLVDHESTVNELITEEAYWDILKVFGSTSEQSEGILSFMESIVKNTPEEITPSNYLAILNLLDEISSLGAVGAQLEQAQEQENAENTQQSGDTEKGHVGKLIEISKRSISLTGSMAELQQKQSYPLLQALAHQCFNPCREVRTHAVHTLQTTILSSTFTSEFTVAGVYEYGFFPLVSELTRDEVFQTDTLGFPETHLQILNLLSKTFLKFHPELSETDRNKVWLGVVDKFVVVNQVNSAFGAKEVKEQSLEVMKNMILVLQNEFLTPESTELWDDTWKRLDVIYPELREEVTKT